MQVQRQSRQERIPTLPDSERQQRIQLIRTYWTALTTGDFATFASLLAPDAVIHYPGRHYLSGDYRTTRDIVDLYRRLYDFGIKDGLFHGEVLDILVGETYTSVVLRYDLALPHRTIPGRAVGLFVIEQGRIKEYWLHEWDQAMINGVFRMGRILKPFARFFRPSPPRRPR